MSSWNGLRKERRRASSREEDRVLVVEVEMCGIRRDADPAERP